MHRGYEQMSKDNLGKFMGDVIYQDANIVIRLIDKKDCKAIFINSKNAEGIEQWPLGCLLSVNYMRWEKR